MGAVFAGAKWVKSSHSAIGNCVEATKASVNGVVGVRDTKDRDGVVLELSAAAWSSFLLAVRSGEFSG